MSLPVVSIQVAMTHRPAIQKNQFADVWDLEGSTNELTILEDIEWKDCSTALRYKTADRHDDMTPIYNYLIDGGYGLNILVVSGDDDSVCATIGTQNWIWDLGLTYFCDVTVI